MRDRAAALSAALVATSVVALAGLALLFTLTTWWGSAGFGLDFKSVAPPIRGLLHGTNPYVFAGMQDGRHFLWSILAGWLLMPFAWTPYGWILFEVLGVLAFPLTARLLGTTDWRTWTLALAWPATVNGLKAANITMLVAVLIGLAWHERHRSRVGLWLGLAVAVKLFAWPVVVWLAATRRWRALCLAAAVQVFAALVTLPYISLVDFARYEQQVDRVFSGEAITPYALLLGWGIPGARVLVVAAGLLLLLWGRRDLGWCVVVALFLSPVVWLHYFDLLIVPLALWDAPLAVWALPLGLWLTGPGNATHWQTLTALLIVTATAAAGWRWRSRPPSSGAPGMSHPVASARFLVPVSRVVRAFAGGAYAGAAAPTRATLPSSSTTSSPSRRNSSSQRSGK
jgi:hypothetical protein